MARSVADLAMFLDAMAGDDWRDPLSQPAGSRSYQQATHVGQLPRRVAWSRNLGLTPVDPEVAAVCEAAARQFDAMGVEVEETHPDLTEAHECFEVLRAATFAAQFLPLMDRYRHQLKPEIVWNVEKGLALTGAAIARAVGQRAVLFERSKRFFADYDLLLAPTAIVPPFPVEQRFVEECAGRHFSNYVEWLAITYAITLIACPALSLPAGFTAQGLPVGLQIIARPRAERMLLGAARRLEDALGLLSLTPIDPRRPTEHA
jgi:amidase